MDIIEWLKAYITSKYSEDNVPAEFHDLLEYAGENPLNGGENSDSAARVAELEAEVARLKQTNLKVLFELHEKIEEKEEEVREIEEEKDEIMDIEEIIKEGVEY